MLKLICGRVRCISRSSTRPLVPHSIIPRARPFSDDSNVPIGGGLEKLQGGLKEESYFQTQNYDLITKIREQGSKLKCENCLDDWTEFDKVLAASVVPTALRETCSMNKHRNCLEEAFFMSEQNECTQLIKEKLSNDSMNFEYEKQIGVDDTPQEEQQLRQIEENYLNNEDISK